jgi:riboflavin biosynthesis pyrimidine reductase
VVLVAAGTVRAERYGPSSVPVAVVSRSCRFDWEAPFFSAQRARPMVVTVAAAPKPLRDRAAEVADVVIAGERDVDLARALDELGAMGFRAVLSEGGPNLNAQLAAAGLIDELCLTLTPSLVGGDAKRILDGPVLPGRPPLRLRSLCEQDGFLFLRWRPGAATPR